MAVVVRSLAGRLSPWPTPRAVLFDLDDTLIDRSATILRFAARFARDFGDWLAERDPARLHAAIVAADRGGYRSREELAENLLRLLPWRERPTGEVLQRYWADHFGPSSQASTGALGLISWLRARGVKTGIVTNGAATQHVKIDALGVRSHMDAIVVSEEVGYAKPDARIFRRALRHLRVEPREAWFVGDHPVNDVAGAAAVGMRAFWLRRQLPWPGGQALAGAPIDSLDELLPLLVEATPSDASEAPLDGAFAPSSG